MRQHSRMNVISIERNFRYLFKKNCNNWELQRGMALNNENMSWKVDKSVLTKLLVVVRAWHGHHLKELGTGLWLFRALSRLAFFPLIKVTPLKDSCFRPSIFEWILAFLVSNDRFGNPEWAFQLPVDYIFSFICLKSKNPDVMTWFGHFGQKFSEFFKKKFHFHDMFFQRFRPF